MESKGLSDAKTVRFILKRDYQLDFDEQFDNIEKELKKPQQLYDLIKQKRDNAQDDYENDIKYNELDIEYFGGLLYAYNEILSLMEKMFEVKENAKKEN